VCEVTVLRDRVLKLTPDSVNANVYPRVIGSYFERVGRPDGIAGTTPVIVTVADHGGFRRAAEACHAAQPSLSAQVALAEELLGVRLFERDRRHVRLSPAGKRSSSRLDACWWRPTTDVSLRSSSAIRSAEPCASE
jgi:hypothetical protein